MFGSYPVVKYSLPAYAKYGCRRRHMTKLRPLAKLNTCVFSSFKQLNAYATCTRISRACSNIA